jgi:membrane protein
MKQREERTGAWKLIMLLLLLEVLFFYLVQLIVPSCNILVEKVDNQYVGYVNDRDGYRKITFSNEGKGRVYSDLYHIDETIEINIPKKTASASVPVTVLDLEKLHPYTYQGMYDVIIHNTIPKQAGIFIVLNVCLVIVLLFAKGKRYTLAQFATCFYYRSKKQTPWTKKQWALLGIVLLISFVVAPGVDLPSITRMMSQFVSGGDIYQIQNLREIEVYSFSFNSYPYNPVMLLLYAIPNLLSFGFAPIYLQTKFLWLPAVIFKVYNALMMREMILSLEGYMLDCGILEQSRKTNFWQVFLTPLVFYVAIVYIQLDVLPMYLLGEGLLQLLRENGSKKNQAIGSILAALGCFCKMQNLMMVPACLMVYFVLIWQRREELINVIFFLGTLAFGFVNAYVINPSIGIFLSQNKQSERIWYSSFQYVQGIYLYITVFALILLFSLAALQLRATVNRSSLLFWALLLNAALVLLFSATILATPSVYILTFPAFVYLLYQEDDALHRMLLWGFSTLILMDVVFTTIGDITSAISYFGRVGFFTQLEQSMAGTVKGTQFACTLMTVAKAGMILYTILFYGELKSLLGKHGEKEMS